MHKMTRSIGSHLSASTIAVLCLSLAADVRGQPVLFVNASQTAGGNDGSSWADAFQGSQGLQSALAAAVPGSGTQIWVAAGRYTPAPANGDRNASFALKSGVAMYGGFTGNETLQEQRDAAAHVAILSGDLNGNDTANGQNKGENSRHVVRGTNLDGTALLDGFTIRDGHTDSQGSQTEWRGGNLLFESSAAVVRHCIITAGDARYGGGASLVASSALIEDCEFNANNTQSTGGGLANFDAGLPILRRCRFEANIGGRGAGLFTGPFIINGVVGGLLTVIDCEFIDNTGTISFAPGVGMFVDRGPVRVIRSRFENNTTDAGGGGIYLANAPAVVVACDFVRNDAPGDGGGAIYVDGQSAAPPNLARIADCRFVGNNGAIFTNAMGRAELANCTIANNNLGSGFLAWSAVRSNGSIKLRNCLVWGNTPVMGSGLAGVLGGGGEITADSCDVQFWNGTRPGTGTFASDPLFINSAGADGAQGTTDDDVHPKPASPCVDAGNDALLPTDDSDLDGDGNSAEPLPLDLDGRSRVTGCRVDIGAFERPGGRPRSGDLTGDGATDAADIAPFVAALLNPTIDCIADTDGDGGVDGRDVAGFVACIVNGC